MDQQAKIVSVPLIAVIVLSGFLFFFRLGERSLRNPDEGRYAEIAREMVISNDWLEPTLYGVDYLRKPILFYWLLASSFKLFGQNEFSARLIPALFGLFGVLATYFFTKRYFGNEKAFFTSLILATNLFYLEMSRYLLIDAVFAFFLICVFYSAYLALEERRRSTVIIFYVFLALAFLTKGVAGIAIPAFALLVYLVMMRKLKTGAAQLLSLKGIFIFLVITLPWFIGISLREPEFLRFFFLHEHLSRYLSKGFEHQEAWYFYLALLPLIFFPWSLFAAPLKTALKPKEHKPNNPRFYLRVTFFATLLFYSLSRSKLATYLIPIIPFGSILLGDAWISWIEKKEAMVKLRKSNLLTLVLAALFIFSAFFVIISPLFGLDFPKRIPEEIRFYVFSGLVLLVIESVIFIICVLRHRRKALFYSLIAFLSLTSILIAFIMGPLNEKYSTKHFAEFLKPRLTSADTVFIYSHPGAFYDFAFYLNRPVKLVGLEGELEFNMEDYKSGEDEVRRAVVMPDEWKRLVTKEKVYCLMRRSDYLALEVNLKARLKVLMEDERKVLVESGEKR